MSEPDQPVQPPAPQVGVRAARAEDAAAITAVQLAAWAGLPAAPAVRVDADERGAMVAQWRASISEPPSPRHRVLVAVEGDPRAGQVVGVAATAPSTDPDRDPERTSELLALSVAPDHGRRGHGSRLLAAVADLLGEEGTRIVVAWVAETDLPLRNLLTSSGWRPDGARRELELDDGSLVAEDRFHAGVAR